MDKIKDYYAILGISEASTVDEIKKSYKKLAMQYHPDKNSAKDAEEKFKQIAEAYEILGNTEKRAKYDLSRKFSTSGSSGAFRNYETNEKAWRDKKSGWSFDEYVKSKSSKFKNSDFGKGKGFGGDFTKPSTEYLDINITESIDLKDAILGIKMGIEYDRYMLKPDLEKEKEVKKILVDIELTKKYLNIIQEDGKVYLKAKISKLGNEDIQNRLNTWGDNEKIPLFGDLHIKILINIPDNIKLEGKNIIQYITVPLTKVLFKGEKVRIETINDKAYDAEISKPIKLNDLKFIIKDNGIIGSDGTPGDYIIRFEVTPPDLSKLTSEQKDTLRDLLD